MKEYILLILFLYILFFLGACGSSPVAITTNTMSGTRSSECVIKNEPCSSSIVLGEIAGKKKIIQSFVSDKEITMIDILFATYGRNNTKDIFFYLTDDPASGEYMVSQTVNASTLLNNNWQRFKFSPVKSKKGNKYFIIIESPDSNTGNAVTVWASSDDTLADGDLMIASQKTIEQDMYFRVFALSENNGIEYYIWNDLTEDHWNRKIYRSNYNNIAMSFGDMCIMSGFFYEHFWVYDVYKAYDYFCVPDDLLIAYNDNDHFWSRCYTLNWKTEHGLLDNNQKAYLTHTYTDGSGFNSLTPEILIEKTAMKPPPVDISVSHELYYKESYVPMKITVRNTYSETLRFIYFLQDGAWMTEQDLSIPQANVHQYWDDGECNYARLWTIDESSRNNKNNWVGMYNDSNGGMFAATYAPPESDGIRYHATWDDLKNVSLQSSNFENILQSQSIDWFLDCQLDGQQVIPDWYKFENLLYYVDTPNKNNLYDNYQWKWHGTAIDFGNLNPGEEKTQIIVKIMFTGYRDRQDMYGKIKYIISRIPSF